MMEGNNTQPPPESTLKIPFYPIEFVGNVCKNSSEWTDTHQCGVIPIFMANLLSKDGILFIAFGLRLCWTQKTSQFSQGM